MAKSLLLHVGDPKTGTSSIQKVLFERRWTCASKVLDYPEVVSSMALANALRHDAGPEEAEELFPPYAFWLEHSKSDVAVISAEQFSSVDPRKVDETFRKYFPDLAPSMRVVAYARPHAGRFLSAYAQRVKTGHMTQSLDRFFSEMAQSRILLMHQRFSRWRAVFGDRFILRPMVREELMDGDAVADFINVALEGAPFEVVGSTQANISLPIEALAGLRLVQAVLRRAEVRGGTVHAVGDRLSTLVTGRPGLKGTKVGLNAQLAERLQDAMAADARAMDESFFGKPIMVQALAAAGKGASEKAASIEMTDHFRPRPIVKLKRAARELAEELKANKGLWVRSHRRDKGLKPQFVEDSALSAKAPEAIAKADKLMGEIAEILFRACSE